MDTAHWPQEIVVKPIEEIVVTKAANGVERKPRPQKEQALNCPRCNSINTKFCYYNNYSLTQPRYFCKTCRRYWTEGGSLRNIPVGGGSRKNKRPSSLPNNHNNNVSITNKKLPDLVTTPSPCTDQNPKINNFQQGQDLNLGFPATSAQDFIRNMSDLVQQNNMSASTAASSNSSSTTTTTSHLSALELITGITTNSTSSRGLSSFLPVPVPTDPNSVYSTCGFPLQDFKPCLNFSLDGYASLQSVQESTSAGRLLFPFEDLKQVSTTTTTAIMDQNDNNINNNNNKEQQGGSSGYWTGMLGGGSW
ncbi:hypothetical protein RJT34_23349 [Clitoria ternatea]|uniref:Dof zinc finger protein n=1 Tax=Clitoria ternatea TaxID=43366 RepID=A0AAN9FKU8_CLITE